MYFIEKLQINRDNIFNILKFAIIIYLAFLVIFQIASMKKSLDFLYGNSLISISALNKANAIYHINIQNNIYQSITLNITPTQALLDMKNSLPIVEKIWKDYEKRFQYNDKSEYLEYALLEIGNINNYFKQINRWCSNIENIQKLSLKEIDNEVAKADIIIQELLRYEHLMAQQERNKILLKFNNFIYQIILLLIIGVFFIIKYIYSINNKQLLLKKEFQKIASNCEMLDNLEYRDAITSLYTRRYFNYIYKEKIYLAKDNKSSIALIMIEIDYFTEYNNSYGFEQGDALLNIIADILKDIIDEKNDFVFKFDSEAFRVLLTQTDEQKTIAFEKKILTKIKLKQIEHKGSKIDKYVTVSIGSAFSKIESTTTEYSLISKADKMLSISKDKNRI